MSKFWAVKQRLFVQHIRRRRVESVEKKLKLKEVFGSKKITFENMNDSRKSHQPKREVKYREDFSTRELEESYQFESADGFENVHRGLLEGGGHFPNYLKKQKSLDFFEDNFKKYEKDLERFRKRPENSELGVDWFDEKKLEFQKKIFSSCFEGKARSVQEVSDSLAGSVDFKSDGGDFANLSEKKVNLEKSLVEYFHAKGGTVGDFSKVANIERGGEGLSEADKTYLDVFDRLEARQSQKELEEGLFCKIDSLKRWFRESLAESDIEVEERKRGKDLFVYKSWKRNGKEGRLYRFISSGVFPKELELRFGDLGDCLFFEGDFKKFGSRVELEFEGWTIRRGRGLHREFLVPQGRGLSVLFKNYLNHVQAVLSVIKEEKLEEGVYWTGVRPRDSEGVKKFSKEMQEGKSREQLRFGVYFRELGNQRVVLPSGSFTSKKGSTLLPEGFLGRLNDEGVRVEGLEGVRNLFCSEKNLKEDVVEKGRFVSEESTSEVGGKVASEAGVESGYGGEEIKVVPSKGGEFKRADLSVLEGFSSYEDVQAKTGQVDCLNGEELIIDGVREKWDGSYATASENLLIFKKKIKRDEVFSFLSILQGDLSRREDLLHYEYYVEKGKVFIRGLSPSRIKEKGLEHRTPIESRNGTQKQRKMFAFNPEYGPYVNKLKRIIEKERSMGRRGSVQKYLLVVETGAMEGDNLYRIFDKFVGFPIKKVSLFTKAIHFFDHRVPLSFKRKEKRVVGVFWKLKTDGGRESESFVEVDHPKGWGVGLKKWGVGRKKERSEMVFDRGSFPGLEFSFVRIHANLFEKDEAEDSHKREEGRGQSPNVEGSWVLREGEKVGCLVLEERFSLGKKEGEVYLKDKTILLNEFFRKGEASRFSASLRKESYFGQFRKLPRVWEGGKQLKSKGFIQLEKEKEDLKQKFEGRRAELKSLGLSDHKERSNEYQHNIPVQHVNIGDDDAENVVGKEAEDLRNFMGGRRERDQSSLDLAGANDQGVKTVNCLKFRSGLYTEFFPELSERKGFSDGMPGRAFGQGQRDFEAIGKHGSRSYLRGIFQEYGVVEDLKATSGGDGFDLIARRRFKVARAEADDIRKVLRNPRDGRPLLLGDLTKFPYLFTEQENIGIENEERSKTPTRFLPYTERPHWLENFLRKGEEGGGPERLEGLGHFFSQTGTTYYRYNSLDDKVEGVFYNTLSREREKMLDKFFSQYLCNSTQLGERIFKSQVERVTYEKHRNQLILRPRRKFKDGMLWKAKFQKYELVEMDFSDGNKFCQKEFLEKSRLMKKLVKIITG